MSPKSHPSPAPKKPICRRLEDIRARTDLKKKDFWRRLRDDGGLSLSYEATLNYHYNRTPPVEYLVAVSEVYGASLVWLATGEGDPEDEVVKAAHEAAGRFIDSALKDIGNGFGEGSEYLLEDGTRRAVLFQAWRRLLHGRADDFWQAGEPYAGRALGEALASPIRALGLSVEDVPRDDLTDYVKAATDAVLHLGHAPVPPERSEREEAGS